MKAIVNTGAGRLEWLDWARPEPGAGQVRIRTVACGICATDLEMIAGWSRTGFPAICGHEWSGVVDAVGAGVDATLIGQPCVAENVLSDGGEVGFEHPGGYAQYLLTEARHVYTLPPDFPMQTAVLIEPLAVCVRGLRRLRLSGEERALIVGDGPIGLLLLLLLRQGGVQEVVMVGGRPARLALARKLGAGITLDRHASDQPLGVAITAAAGNDFPLVIEASGAAPALAAALSLTRVGGRILVLGDYGHAHASFPWNQVLHRELELIGSNASAGAWPEAVRLATTGGLPLERLITHRFPAADYVAAMDEVRRAQSAVKVVLNWAPPAG